MMSCCWTEANILSRESVHSSHGYRMPQPLSGSLESKATKRSPFSFTNQPPKVKYSSKKEDLFVRLNVPKPLPSRAYSLNLVVSPAARKGQELEAPIVLKPKPPHRQYLASTYGYWLQSSFGSLNMTLFLRLVLICQSYFHTIDSMCSINEYWDLASKMWLRL